MVNQNQAIGYLPDERPPVWKLLLYALQQVVVMFPATITVALLTGFHVSTTIFASGLATICFILITGRQIPLYYGSSFSYLSAILALMAQDQIAALTLNERIATAQFGIVMSGFVSIAAGLLVKASGKNVIDKILPASVTGPIAMVIGLTLAGNALGDAASFGPNAIPLGLEATAANMAWVISLVTLLCTVLFSRYLRGFLSQLPLLLGPAVGCIVAAVIGQATGLDFFRHLSPEATGSGLFALPIFTLPKPSMAALWAIMPIAIATIPESTAHVFQLDIYVNDLARKKRFGKIYNIADKLGLNLIGDGIGDMVAGFIGGPAGTNYGENISAMAITKVFSTSVLIGAAVIAMVISCFTPLIDAIYAIPTPVIGGLEIYLFGAIAAQGIAIMIEKKTDMFSSKNIAVIACIMVIALGGQYQFGGTIPFFGVNVPCIAGAAIFGIALNGILSIGEKRQAQSQ